MRKHRNGEWTDEQWLSFTSRTEFWEWVNNKCRRQTKLYLFCHNTSFDLPVLDVFRELGDRRWILKSAIIDAPPTVLVYRLESRTIVILDTLNIWRMPLAYMGAEIGLPKLDMPDNNDLSAEWETYARRDVEIIRSACIKWWDFLQRNDMGSFATTLAGQSMRVFRHKYMRHRIYIDDNPRALKLTREGYYGGRVECFRIGRYKGNFYSFDVNSMYPAVMASAEYPVKLISHTRYATAEDIHVWLKRYCVTARVILRTTRQFAAVRKNYKLIFPIGEFEGILSSSELAYALEHAEIVKVIECAVYERAPVFRDMMLVLTKWKSEAKHKKDYVLEHQVKKIVNSFYGKWGQSGGKWLEEFNHDDLSCKRWTEIDADTGKIIHHRQLAGLVQTKDEDPESRDSFPAIAAHVTANARMLLWSLIETVGLDNVWYCDTDSLLVNDTGRERLSHLLDEYDLGKLKLVGEYHDIEIWGAKDYRFGEKEKHKGVRKKAVWLDSHKVKQEQWSGLRGLIQSGETDAPLTKTIVKYLKRIYEKGLVRSDGTVEPYQLSPEYDQLERQVKTEWDALLSSHSKPFLPPATSDERLD